MQAIVLQIVGLLIIVTLIILFFSKPNVDNVETKIYSKLIGLNFLFIVVGILTYIIAKLTGNITFIGVLQKVYMSILTLLNLYSVCYCISVSDKDEKYNIFKKISIIITGIAILLIVVLPLNVIFEGDLLDGEGLSYDVAIIHTVLSFLFFFIVTVYLLSKKHSIIKVFPYIILVILYIVGFLIRNYYKELIFEGFFYSYILFIMYNTIENPDVKMAKELAYQKQLAEMSSKKTLELLEDMSNDLKSSVKKLEQFGNKKIDKRNIEELNKELSNFQESSIKLSDKISGIMDLAIVKGDSKVSEYKYEVKDMLDKLKQLLFVDTKNNKVKLDIEISDDIPNVVYGDENNVIKIVLYFYNLVLSLIKDNTITLKIDSIEIGRFSRLKFKFITDDISIQQYIYKNRDTKELELVKSDDINYQIINNLLKKFNGKMIVSQGKDNISISLCINQRILTEYEIISNKEENKNIKIKYSDFSGKRILIVDNNNLKIKEMKILLKPYNVEVLSVNTPDEMSEILNDNETFDLIFVDDIIPSFKIDDFTNEILTTKDNFLNYIRKDAKYSITTVIMVTPNNENMEEKYLKYGFHDYIVKPINKNNLNELLLKYFDNKTRSK